MDDGLKNGTAVKDLFIVRPVKLIKEEKYYKFNFPYNILYKLHLIEPNRFKLISNNSLMEKLKYKISMKIPDHIMFFAPMNLKRKYNYSTENLSLAIKDKKVYRDIFNNYIYYIGKYPLSHDEKALIINQDIFEPQSLGFYLVKDYKKESFSKWNKMLSQVIEKRYSKDELEQIKKEIMAEENVVNLILKEETQNNKARTLTSHFHTKNKVKSRRY